MLHGSSLSHFFSEDWNAGDRRTCGKIRGMTFAAIIEYCPDLARIAEVRPTHREYLKELLKNGRLVLAGPITDDSGALIVYEAATPEQAEDLIRGDPFHQQGVFVSWKIRPWKPVMANHSLLPA
jgi:uncharacterized protein YciI